MNARIPEIPVGAIRAASRRADILAAMGSFYEQVDRLIAEHHPVCWNRGLCCRFGAFGHRLFVTPLEVAAYLAGVGTSPQVREDGCPHARDGRCEVRAWRPLGCRIFYCDPAASEWQGPLTEEQLTILRRWHERFHVDYVYADWMAVLEALADCAESSP
jgi:hypothetical protein